MHQATSGSYSKPNADEKLNMGWNWERVFLKAQNRKEEDANAQFWHLFQLSKASAVDLVLTFKSANSLQNCGLVQIQSICRRQIKYMACLMEFVFDKVESIVDKKRKYRLPEFISMGESNTVVNAYTLYRHLQQYCSHPSICSTTVFSKTFSFGLSYPALAFEGWKRVGECPFPFFPVINQH